MDGMLLILVYTTGTLLLLRPTTAGNAGVGSDGWPECSASDERHGGDGSQLWHLQTRLAGAGGEAEARCVRGYGPCGPPAGCVCFQQG